MNMLRWMSDWSSYLPRLTLGFMLTATGAAADPTQIILGTSTQGGGFSLFGKHFAAVINETDPTLRVEPVSTKGSRENLPLLETGRLDIGLVEGNAARVALDGVNREPVSLTVLCVMYPNPGMFVVPANSAYKTIDDLKGKPIAFGTRASGLRILANDMLDGLGLRTESDFEQVILNKASEGPQLVLEGKVAALWGAGIGWPGFVKVAQSQVGARFIAPNSEEIERIRAKHPHLRPMSVPAGTYRGQDRRIDSLGLWALILTRADLPDEVGYRLARALHSAEGALAARLPQGRYATLSHTAEEVPSTRLHPGVVRYLAELGHALSGKND